MYLLSISDETNILIKYIKNKIPLHFLYLRDIINKLKMVKAKIGKDE
jgi:hypothetical protein